MCRENLFKQQILFREVRNFHIQEIHFILETAVHTQTHQKIFLKVKKRTSNNLLIKK